MLKKSSILVFISFLFILFTNVVPDTLAGPAASIDPEQTSAFLGSSAMMPGSDGDQAVSDVIATIIQAFLGILGLIFLTLTLYAGYLWMTAGGDETKVTKARTLLQQAVIGLLIIVSTYSITYFVFGRIGDSQKDSGQNAIININP